MRIIQLLALLGFVLFSTHLLAEPLKGKFTLYLSDGSQLTSREIQLSNAGAVVQGNQIRAGELDSIQGQSASGTQFLVIRIEAEGRNTLISRTEYSGRIELFKRISGSWNGNDQGKVRADFFRKDRGELVPMSFVNVENAVHDNAEVAQRVQSIKRSRLKNIYWAAAAGVGTLFFGLGGSDANTFAQHQVATRVAIVNAGISVINIILFATAKQKLQSELLSYQ